MANFKDSPKFQIQDEYYTPKKAWQRIQHLLPKHQVIWEAFGLNPSIHSAKYLRELGFKVVTTDKDFFGENKGDIVVSNPPYNKKEKLKQKVLSRLVALDKPFILIMPTTTIHTKYYRDIFGENIKYLQLLIPDDKIQFYTLDGEGNQHFQNNCSFYSIYLCYKLYLPKDIMFV